VDCAHALGDGGEGLVELGDHALGDDAVGDRFLAVGHGEAGDARGGIAHVAQHAGDVAHQDEGARVEGDRHLVRHDVGVDVVDGALLVGAEAREDRDVARAGEEADEVGVHAGHVADVAEVDGVGPAAADDARRALDGAHREGARAVQAHGGGAGGEERGARVHVHLAGDDHLHDLERVGVGDATAGDDLRRLAELLLQVGGLRAAAVHEDDAIAAAPELGRVCRDRRHVRRGDDLAAQLDDDRRVWSPFGQSPRLRRMLSRAHGQPPGSWSVRRSSRPSMMFIDWIAWPAPPLIRLSVAAKHATSRLPPATSPGCTPTSA